MANNKWNGSNPWLGLAPYTEGTPLYGRTRESAQVSDIIKDNMASVVFGKSGIGKSSLLSAGISPLLREENYIPVRIRLVHNTDTSYVEQIENTIRETVNCHDRLPANVDDLGLWDFFHRHTFTTDDGEDCVPVVILDQFEEIYTLTDADHKKDTISFFIELSALLNGIKPDNVIEEERRYSNVQSIPTATTVKRGIIKRTSSSSLNYTSATTFRFVVCLREDKLYLLERSSANIPSLKANRYNLQALSPESALEVIMCPRPDLFSNEEATAIIDKLADMGDEGVRTVDPAILSLFLYKYYEKQGQANYDNIFADYYQEATKDINGKSIAFLENHLLTLGGYRNQVPLDDALSSGVTQSEIDSLLNQIILRTEKRKGIDYIEFSHDRLCAEAKKNREDRNMREQARKVRRRLLLSFFIFALSAAMLSVVLVLFFKWQSSEEGRLSAEEGQQTAEARRLEEKRQKDALALLNAENKRQKDSLALLNGKNLAQKLEIERQRDELQAKNKTLTAQQQEIEHKNAELQNMNKELQSKNKDLSAKVATIEEQRRIIERLQLGSAKNLTVRNKEAGKLSESEVLPYNALANLDSLTISGFLNGTDIKYLRDNGKNLKFLNLHDVNIVEGGGAYSGKTITKNNVIGEGMFNGLSSLVEIILPQNATSIETRAFQYSGLTSITIPNSVTSIGNYAFNSCHNLTSITIPSSVSSIGNNAFLYCGKLSSVTIPNSVTSIGYGTFSDCDSLTSVTIPNSVTSIGTSAFYKCRNLTSINIPNSVTSIGSYAFYGCSNLTSINIPNSVKSIGDKAFDGCVFSSFINNSSCFDDDLWGAKLSDLETKDGLAIKNKMVVHYRGKSSSVTIPEGVTVIGGHAFEKCTWLTSVTVQNGVTAIGNDAFFGCSNLTSINIPNSVTSIGSRAFSDCSNLTSINLPNSVTSIGSRAFSDCSNLTSINLPNSITSIDNDTFDNCCNLTSINIPNSVTSIGNGVFYGCSNLTSINIPNSVTSIGNYAFKSCHNLTSITIPSSVTSIGNEAFRYCKNLTSIAIPNSVTTIGEGCFSDCENLAHIESRIVDIDGVKVGVENEKVTPFNKIFSNCTWHVPEGTIEKYTSRPWWVPSWQIIEDSDMGKDVNASYKDGVLNVNGVQYNLLPVEGGTFMMGAIDRPEYKVTWEDGTIYDLGEDARPVHEVTLSSYRIGETEITQALWTAVMGYNPSEQKGDNLPVENLSWNDCQSFILKLNALTGMNFRLPTEAEWEFAARGGNKSKNTLFSGSNNLNDVAWFEDNSNDKIHPVKQKRPNELGIYDMCGNVSEWCHDRYGNYQDKHVTNPTGSYNAKERIIRGSNYNLGMVWAYLPIRVTGEPQDKNAGIRLVLSE